MNQSKINEIANKRQAAISRLLTTRNEHREKSWALQDSKAGALSVIQDRKTVVENIGVIAGFFPTPAGLADEMISIAHLEPGCSILEPSAGAAGIADRIRAAGFEPFCIEVSYTLAQILRRKNYQVYEGDFLEYSQPIDAIQYRYDRVLMNPPFEHGQDIDHVLHAYDLLNPGGRISAIMSAGTWYRSDRKAAEFRHWFEDRGLYIRDLPSGTFSASGTGVSASLVAIHSETDA